MTGTEQLTDANMTGTHAAARPEGHEHDHQHEPLSYRFLILIWVALMGLTALTVGVAKVDLSDEFDDGGGTLSVTMRLAQVIYTLCQFPTIDSVEFYMDGTKIDVFTGEGLMLDGPQTPEDYYNLIPVDA